jgi:hypothetical protein
MRIVQKNPMCAGPLPGQQRRATWAAHRTGRDGMRKVHARRLQPIQVWGLHIRIARVPRRAGAPLIRQHHHHIRPPRRGIRDAAYQHHQTDDTCSCSYCHTRWIGYHGQATSERTMEASRPLLYLMLLCFVRLTHAEEVVLQDAKVRAVFDRQTAALRELKCEERAIPISASGARLLVQDFADGAVHELTADSCEIADRRGEVCVHRRGPDQRTAMAHREPRAQNRWPAFEPDWP